MVRPEEVTAQLKQLGITVKHWGAAELHELPHILMPDEQITHLINGWYENGFATLVTTDQRLLLIDKKLFNLVVEDIRYDMIAEVDYRASVLDSTICVTTVNKKLQVTSFRQRRLRSLTSFVQQRVMELRQQYSSWSQYEEAPIPEPDPQTQSFFVPEPTRSISRQPMQAPTFRSFSPVNPYSKGSLTTKHRMFLPKIPRRWRPSTQAASHSATR